MSCGAHDHVTVCEDKKRGGICSSPVAPDREEGCRFPLQRIVSLYHLALLMTADSYYQVLHQYEQ